MYMLSSTQRLYLRLASSAGLVADRLKFNEAVLVYRPLNNQTPEYILKLLKPMSEVHTLNLRSSENGSIFVIKGMNIVVWRFIFLFCATTMEHSSSNSQKWWYPFNFQAIFKGITSPCHCAEFALLITLPICCKFQRNLIQVWFYTNCFMISYMYITPGQGAKFWCQQKLLVTSVIWC